MLGFTIFRSPRAIQPHSRQRLGRGAARLTIAATVLACSDPADPATSTGTVTSPMSAVIDGKPWTAMYITPTVSTDGKMMTLFGLAGLAPPADTRGIYLDFNLSGVGRQQLAAPRPDGLVSDGQPTWISYTPTGTNDGYIIIDSLTSHRIVGTFEFTASADKSTTTPAMRQVTSGRFAIPY
jgi:hypothetical protein